MGLVNINVGVMGHVDSGKTSLTRVLSSVASTAAFDKNPQSQERGITLDLGFSSFAVESSGVQYTLVDCPGHASLIRTVISGAHIIDLVLLVIDVTKGVQTQTAECIVIAEIICPRMIVVINKIDLIPLEKREQTVEKMRKRLRAALGPTPFRDSPIVAVAARPDSEGSEAIGVGSLVQQLSDATLIPQRDSSGPFVFLVDHCFSIKGQGTIMTGTILQGKIAVGESLEITGLKEVRKVKSMQMFRRPVESASAGDRVGVCVTQFDAKLLERGMVCAPGTANTAYAVVINLRRISYFKGSIASRAKFHISVGHETVLARVSLFGSPDEQDQEDEFSPESEYLSVESLPAANADISEQESAFRGKVFALLEFERPVSVMQRSQVLGSKLDTDVHTPSCRLAFHGVAQHILQDKDYAAKELPTLLRVYKTKHKRGVAERANNDYEIIGKNMFKKETKLSHFLGLRVELSTGEKGILEDSFGQSGKFKVRIPEGLANTTLALLDKKKKTSSNDSEPITISLAFKKYVYSKKTSQ